ncbi:hypothetical protein BH18ACT9_BH18ACT9_01450 [soil metagenome]
MLSDAEEVPLGPVEDLLNRYAHYLRTERGLAPATAKGYLGVVRPFVASRRQGDQLDLLGLTTADVTRYALASCPGRATGSAKMIVGALRSLLRWLHVTGMVPVPLASPGEGSRTRTTPSSHLDPAYPRADPGGSPP